jgi:hypothetical protein
MGTDMPRPPSELMSGGFGVYETAESAGAHALRVNFWPTEPKPEAGGLDPHPLSAAYRSVSDVRFESFRLAWFWRTLTPTIRVCSIDP